jgi:hypothetical protein
MSPQRTMPETPRYILFIVGKTAFENTKMAAMFVAKSRNFDYLQKYLQNKQATVGSKSQKQKSTGT